MLFALVLVSAFLHAAWNALLKRARDPRAAVHPVVGLSGLIAGGFALFALARGGPLLTPLALAWSAAAGLFEARYFHALGAALAAGPLGPVYTLSRGGAAVLIWPLSAALLAEELSLLGAAGSSLVIAGLACATFERGLTARAARSAFECAGLIAGYHFAYKLALRGDSEPAAVFTVSMAVAGLVNFAVGGLEHRQAFAEAVRSSPARILGAGTLCAASFLIFMVTLARGGAAYVFTLRNTSVLFATLLALLMGERVSARSALGALLVCLGATLLGLSG